MKFKTWIETMTSTGSIAMFVRPMMGMVTRKSPSLLMDEDDEKPKKKKKKKEKKD